MIWRVTLWCVVAVVLAFLLMPIVFTVISSFAATSILTFPPSGFTLRWYRAISPEFFSALKVSVIVAAGTAALATLVGAPAALALARGRFVGRALLGTICLSPLMVPTLVIGVAAFQFSIKIYDWFGLTLGGTIVGLILGQSAFAIPFVVRAAIAGHAHFDRSLEEAANSLGAGPLYTFFHVTLPVLAPGIASGAIFAVIMSLDDVPIALFMGGGSATTLPVKIFTAIEFSLEADVMAIATIIVAASLLLMLALDRLVGIDRFFGVARGR